MKFQTNSSDLKLELMEIGILMKKQGFPSPFVVQVVEFGAENEGVAGLMKLWVEAQRKNTGEMDVDSKKVDLVEEGSRYVESLKNDKALTQGLIEKSNTKQAHMKPMILSPELSEIIGAGPFSRLEVVSKVWDYVKKHNLQNPKNKRNIIADEKLAKVFGKREVTMFELAGVIGKNLY